MAWPVISSRSAMDRQSASRSRPPLPGRSESADRAPIPGQFWPASSQFFPILHQFRPEWEQPALHRLNGVDRAAAIVAESGTAHPAAFEDATCSSCAPHTSPRIPRQRSSTKRRRPRRSSSVMYTHPCTRQQFVHPGTHSKPQSIHLLHQHRRALHPVGQRATIVKRVYVYALLSGERRLVGYRQRERHRVHSRASAKSRRHLPNNERS